MSVQEQTMRGTWVNEAQHSVFLEGLSVSRELVDDTDDYIVGQISADELVAQTRARFGLA